MSQKNNITIFDRQKKEKYDILEQLKKAPIIEFCCKKVGIARSTFYKWKSEDPEFANAVAKAMAEGVEFLNDMSETQLVSQIRDNNLGAITFWLKHRHSAYGTKIKVEADVKNITSQELTKEQEDLIKQAMRLADLSCSEDNSQKNDTTNTKQ